MNDKSKATGSTLITDFAEFYLCDGDSGVRYYPKTSDKRGAAIDYSAGGMPPTVKGYAVYDTTISADYAVALYASEAEAADHQAVDAPKAPDTIFDEIDEPEELDDAEAEEEEYPTTKTSFKSKRTFKKSTE